MIRKVEILKGERGLFLNSLYKKREFYFESGLNIITGRNGSGKSLLLKMIYNKLISNDFYDLKRYIKINYTKFNRVIYIDSSMVTPEAIYDGITAYKEGVKNISKLILFDGDYKKAVILIASNLSDGEKKRYILNDLLSRLNNENNSVILLDEIENHLDIDYQKEYFETLIKISNHNQLIIASHSIFAFKDYDKNINIVKLNPQYYNQIKKLFFKKV